jgi:MIP family channel proteins
VGEFIAMTLFVFIGCGSAMSIAKAEGSAWVLQVSLAFGIAITVLAYTIGHYSGGHMNCAVTLGLVIVGNCSVMQGIGNLVAQLLGSVLGAKILWVAYSGIPNVSLDRTGGLGTNTVGDGVPMVSALICEIVGTFLLMYVVLETAVNKANDVGNMAPLAIGFAVFLAHSVLIPIDGCSINPTRSFGPAIINQIMNPKSDGKAIQQLWIFFVGPLIGAALAAGVYKGMQA